MHGRISIINSHKDVFERQSNSKEEMQEPTIDSVVMKIRGLLHKTFTGEKLGLF